MNDLTRYKKLLDRKKYAEGTLERYLSRNRRETQYPFHELNLRLIDKWTKKLQDAQDELALEVNQMLAWEISRKDFKLIH